MSLHKRGAIYWAEFRCNGVFFRRSTHTSNWRDARREEKRLIADAEAGNLPARAPVEQRSASIKASHADRKVRQKVLTQNRKHGKDAAIKEKRSTSLKFWNETVGKDGKKNSELKSPIMKAVWLRPADPRTGMPSYCDRNRAGQDRAWDPTRRKGRARRNAQRNMMIEKCRDSDFLERRKRASLKTAIRQARELGMIPGRQGETMETKIRKLYVAALRRSGRSAWKEALLVYPEHPRSAEKNVMRLLSEHRKEIEALREGLSEDEAGRVLQVPIRDAIRERKES
jgi:hypothetical protein